jgi:hypothetical protein
MVRGKKQFSGEVKAPDLLVLKSKRKLGDPFDH